MTTREHIKAVEIDFGDFREWFQMPESEVQAFIKRAESLGYHLSDVDCHVTCWCCEWNQD